MKEVINKSQEELQDSMWIEIIERMENLYAELANNQAEIERKNRELSQAKDFIEDVVKSMLDALMVIDSQGKIKMVNRATRELLGYKEEELMGKPAEIIFAEGEGEKIFFKEKLIKEGFVRDLEMDFRSKKGERIPMTFSGSVMKNPQGEIIGIIGVAKDLRETKRLLAKAAAAEAERAKAAELEKAYRELKELQAQLIHSEKLASIGELAAGIAHEINNPLGGILVYSHLLLEDLEEDYPKRENLEKIAKQATRCKEIVRRLLDFARQPESKMESLNINHLLEETLSLVKNQSLFHNIKINKIFHFPLLKMRGDKAQLQQAFMNIILNAAESMAGDGNLTITTDLTRDDQFLEIRFADSGCGIPPENLKRLFEPFFTTKRTGRGTGLGLAITDRIVERHKGSIEVKSKPGKGTTFIIKLPLGKGK